MATDIAPASDLVDATDFPYRSVSKLAIGSVSLFVVGLLGLIPLFEPMLALGLIGLVCAVYGVRMINQFPAEYGGLPLAKAGMALNGALLAGGFGLHTYIYLTEVPEGYERVHFYELERSKGPDAPTDKAVSIDGKQVFLKGYIHPASGNGDLKQFVLVPDLGTCCFGGQPRSSSMIEVKLVGTKTARYGRTKLKLAGKFEITQRAKKKHDIDNLLFYRLTVDYLN